MRHRTYKMEHLPASLRPTVAAAMVRVAKIAPGNVIVDPMCGAGTILAEARLANIVSSPHDGSLERCQVFGGDGDLHALHASVANLRRWQEPALCCWNAERLPLGRDSVDRIVSNPPFGKQLSADEDVEALYRRMVQEYQRILRPGGRAVLLVGDLPALREACRKYGWKQEGQWRLRLLGQPAHLTVWRKPQELHILSGA